MRLAARLPWEGAWILRSSGTAIEKISLFNPSDFRLWYVQGLTGWSHHA
ncbi:MAG: hypothetical protein KGM99_05105 [Burkholderiales bacterium]|nr:hypothetical protein [Burkholderiales bacterium]